MSTSNKKNTVYIFQLIMLIPLLWSCGSDDVDPEVDVIDGISTLTYVDKSCSSCKFIIEPDAWKFDGKESNVQPGDTVGIPGGMRDGLFITNVEGTADNPIVFINCDGRAVLGLDKDKSKGIHLSGSKHIKIAGTGMIASKYGIAVKGFMGLEASNLSTNFEIYAVEVLEAGYAGIIARSDATCDGSVSKATFTQRNTILHDNYIHDTGGEGIYIGGSHWGSGQSFQPGCEGTLLFEPELIGVRVYNNIVKNTGRDGIQVGSAISDCEIYNNVIENFAQNSEQGHMTGFQINPGTTGKLYNNVINGGNGFGIFMVGQGGNQVYNNLIINPSQDGIQAGDRNPTPGLGFSYINNTIINPGENGYTSWTRATVNNVFYNNIVTTPGNKFTEGVFDNHDVSHNILTNMPDTLLFINPSNIQYGLKAESPAIDIGKDVSSFGIKYDIEGNDRPNGDYDVGAFEYKN